jgi:hypothetical protein
MQQVLDHKQKNQQMCCEGKNEREREREDASVGERGREKEGERERTQEWEREGERERGRGRKSMSKESMLERVVGCCFCCEKSQCYKTVLLFT